MLSVFQRRSTTLGTHRNLTVTHVLGHGYTPLHEQSYRKRSAWGRLVGLKENEGLKSKEVLLQRGTSAANKWQ